MHKIILFPVIFAFSAVAVFGKGSMPAIKASFHCTFNGVKTDSLVAMEINNPAAYSGGIIKPKQSTIIADANGYFNFEIYDMDKDGKSRVLFFFNLEGKKTLVTPSYFLVEAGDSIHLQIYRPLNGEINVTYSGRGSEKYTCAKEIDSLFSHTYIWEIWNDTDQRLWTLSNFRKTKVKASSFPAFRILENYRERISFQAYQVLYADILGRLLTNLDLVTGKLFFNSNNIDKKHMLREFYPLLYGNRPIPDAKYQLFSLSYFNFLMARNGSEIYWARNENDVSLRGAYQHIKKNNMGIKRDYMLTDILTFGNRFPKNLDIQATDSLWKDCFVLTKEEVLENFILNRITRKAKGREGFNFSLPDNHGNSVSLNDFKGRVVLLDVWYTGCGGCAGYSKRLEEFIYPAFRNDSSIVFISISGDTKREVWLKSLQTTVYTRPENINLFTDGFGFDHPLMKYYDFDGAPYSLLFDREGKIYAGNPPTDDMRTLISLIKKAKGSF